MGSCARALAFTCARTDYRLVKSARKTGPSFTALTGKVVRSALGSGRACGDPEATKSVDSDGELWEAVQEGFHDESCSLKPCARRHFPTFHGRADVCFSFDGPALLTRCARAQFVVGIWAVDRCMLRLRTIRGMRGRRMWPNLCHMHHSHRSPTPETQLSGPAPARILYN